eukprot:6213427-Pleurochrysis_carterae.AAC.1
MVAGLVVVWCELAGTHTERCAGCLEVEGRRLATRIEERLDVGFDIVDVGGRSREIDLSGGLRS